MLSLALRNLLRNRRRSLATLMALAIGAASILMFGGYSTNIEYSMQTAYVRTGGHLQIQHRDFFLYGSGNPTAYGISNHAQLVRRVQQDDVLKPMLAVVSPTLQFGGVAGNFAEGVSRTVIGIGLVAPDVNRMRLWNEYDLPLTATHFALEGQPQDAAVVGSGVARVLQICEPLAVANCPAPARASRQAEGPAKALPDDIAALATADGATAAPSGARAQTARGAQIELLAGHANGAPNVAVLNVIRAESQGFKEFDEVAVILHLAQAQRLIYGRTAAKATSIMVQLKETALVPEAAARLQSLVAGSPGKEPLAVIDFKTLNPFYVQTIQLFNMIFGFIFALIGCIVLFTVSNTMSAAVVERTVEIGTLRAVGLRRAGIQRLFVLEGCLLGLIGTALGVALALLIAFAVNNMGLTWLPPGSSEPLPLILRVWGETKMITGTALGLVTIAASSAWWPAYRASRLRIVDALRHT